MDRSPAITISRLIAGSPAHRVCGRWRFKAFLKDYGLSEEDSFRQLQQLAAQDDGLEVALVAHCDGVLAGICLLVREEIDALHAVSPWLASLFVAPEFRCVGVGRALVSAIEDHAAVWGVERLYLYADAAEPFYMKCGWETIERFSDARGPGVLMAKARGQA